MNLLAARIYGSHGTHEELLATLVGGSKKCVAIEPGSWSFEARSSHPYTVRAGDPNVCKSAPLPAKVVASMKIVVAPKAKRSTYLCGWQLRLKDDAAQYGVAPVGRRWTTARRLTGRFSADE